MGRSYGRYKARSEGKGMLVNQSIPELIIFELNLHLQKKLKEKDFMSTEIFAPMEGKIVRIAVKVGEAVEEDDELVVLEAMKMENPICATAGGTVKEIKVKEGDKVQAEQLLVVLG
jgi:acetyl-CoA carboxylase biotin carboxyl carrier protein